jgi:hypothetical protein
MSDPHFSDDVAGRAAPAPEGGAADGRLLLTPALRVASGSPDAGQAAGTVPAQPDTEALRALVQAILREELAGPFGERITRGVRKLVRSDVATLLSARESE